MPTLKHRRLQPSFAVALRLLLAVLSLGAAAAQAQDYVVMKNGDRISGELKRIWNEEVFIEPKYGDEYAVELEHVAYIHTDEPFEVAYRVGRRVESLVGTLDIDDEQKPIVVSDDGQTMPLRAVDNVSEIEEYRDWGIRTDFTANLSTGNSDTSSTRLYTIGTLKLGEHRHQLEVTQDQQRTDGNSTKEQSEISYQDMWTYTDEWFLRSAVNWSRDPIRDLAGRTRLSVGPGYHFFDDSKRTLNFSVAPNYLVEDFGDAREESLAIRATLRYEQRFRGDDLVAFLNADYSQVVEGRENQTIESTVGLRFDVTDDIYVNAQIVQNFESNPSGNSANNDVTYLLGAGVKLD